MGSKNKLRRFKENETFENFIHNDHYPGFEDHEMYMPADKYFKARYIKDLKT